MRHHPTGQQDKRLGLAAVIAATVALTVLGDFLELIARLVESS